MTLGEVKLGQRVRFKLYGAMRDGQVYQVGPSNVVVTFFSGLDRAWMLKVLKAEQLEPCRRKM
jgi:hypothetical protein